MKAASGWYTHSSKWTHGSAEWECLVTSSAVQLLQRKSVLVAVIRRQASASELSRVVPECCGLVWNEVRAQQARGGRHVAIYWDGRIQLEVGVSSWDRLSSRAESYVRQHLPAQ
jgi:hypothetical protein